MVQQGFNELFFVHYQKLPARHAHRSGLKSLLFRFCFSYLLKEVCCSINMFAKGQEQNADARSVRVIFNNL